ncbi:hypothetical protein [Dactylosporangium sp. CA-233914]|uniref:hypothetical protein n=1 Tax=Dactylosporangium sp. CA-233914 TaxID=3239934 RepID=UPI003D8CF869
MTTPQHTAPTPAASQTLRFDPLAALPNATAAALARRAPAGEHVGFDEPSGLWLIAGDTVVGQACCDPATFGEVPVPAVLGDDSHGWRDALARSPIRAPAVPLDVRARAMLRIVWPAATVQAGFVWGHRVRVHADQVAATLADMSGGATSWPAGGGAPVDQLVRAVVSSIFGVCATTINRVRSLRDQLADACIAPVTEAVLPLAVLREIVGRLVRDRAAAPTGVLHPNQADTVVDDLLACRGAGADLVPLDDITALCSALFAAAWDATAELLPRLIDALRVTITHDPAAVAGLATDAGQRADLIAAAMPPAPPVAGWLRVTTQPVLLHHVRIPANVPCLLVVRAAPNADRQPPQLAALRWLAPANPDGAGMTLARLAGDRLLAAAAQRLTGPPDPLATAARVVR